MPLQSLLLTNDEETSHQVRSALQDLGIGIESCTTAAAAGDILARNHLDVAILDTEVPECETLLASLRSSSSSRGALVFIIQRNQECGESPLASQADYVLSRPLSLQQTWRILRNARQRMEFGMLRYFRVRSDSEILLLRNGLQIQAEARNVGRGGIGLLSPEPLQVGEELAVRLQLPDCPTLIEARVKVVWTDEKGLAGLRFLSVPAECRSALEDWIAKRLGHREFAFVFNAERNLPDELLHPRLKGVVPPG